MCLSVCVCLWEGMATWENLIHLFGFVCFVKNKRRLKENELSRGIREELVKRDEFDDEERIINQEEKFEEEETKAQTIKDFQL